MYLDSYKSKLLSKIFIVLTALIPFSFVAGNLVINLNLFIIIVVSFAIFGKEIFNFKFNIIDKLIIILFLYILFVGFLNTIENFYFSQEKSTDITILKKTVLFLRYFFIYFILRFLIDRKILKLKYFFLFSLLASLFVSLDVIYQFIFDQDIFGYERAGRKYPGPFGDEAIAGGYLQRFSVIGIFYILIFQRLGENKYSIIFLTLMLLILFLAAIGISGNRMPLVLFIFILFLIFIFEQKLRKFFIPMVLVLILIFISLNRFVPTFSKNIDNFTGQILWIYEHWKADDKETRSIQPPYYYEFSSFYETWKMNKFFGGGIKSFRVNCIKRDNVIEKWRNFSCNMHPHNYHLEILTDLGFIGYLLIIFLAFKIFHFSIFEFSNSFNKNKLKILLTPLIFLFIAEIFPIRSSGSFFTTNNSAFIFVLIALIAASLKNRNLN